MRENGGVLHSGIGMRVVLLNYRSSPRTYNSCSPMSKPILVTGSHRSGTTWVGRMIAKAPCVTYIHEPFNVDSPRLWSPGFDHWFKYLTDENSYKHQRELRKLSSLQFSLSQVFIQARQEAASLGEFRHLLRRFLKDYVSCLLSQIRGSTPLIKDPIAVLSAEWLAKTWDAQVIVMVRHPAAFAGSLKVKDWTHPFSHFLNQPRLMDGPLSPFEEEIRTLEEDEHDIIDQASFLWKIIYSVVHDYQQRHEDWTFLKHEKIARSPIRSFEAIYDSLGLNFTNDIQATVRRHSEAQSSDGIRRNSKSVVRNWENRLTDDEVHRIRSLTEPEASLFYTEDDW